jgi:hypothetical protein
MDQIFGKVKQQNPDGCIDPTGLVSLICCHLARGARVATAS